jgi:hypothetical protein
VCLRKAQTAPVSVFSGGRAPRPQPRRCAPRTPAWGAPFGLRLVCAGSCRRSFVPSFFLACQRWLTLVGVKASLTRVELAGLIRHNAELVARALEGEAPAREALVVLVRDGGATWAEIGELLHVSRQAAQQRFGAGDTAESTVAGVRQAGQVVAHLGSGEFSVVHAMFDAVMRSKLGADELAAVWRQLEANLGELQGTGTAAVNRKGGYTIVDVPLTFAEAVMKARVTFNADGTIGGLYILNLE